MADNLALLKQNDQGYDAVKNYLTLYIGSVSQNPALTVNDISVLQTTISILDMSFYTESRKRRKDRDWEWSTGHIAATVYGVDKSEANAITYSLAGKFTLQ